MLTESPTSTAERLVLVGTIRGASPVSVTTHLTDPAALRTWWPAEATVGDDGVFAYTWPTMGMTLRGRILVKTPGEHVRFTWRWDHEPDVPERTVDVTVTPAADGAAITISHGDYGPDDVEERTGHLEGWQHFIGVLQQTISGDT